MSSRRIVSTLLLVAMGLQAITPDPCDLSSPWLLDLLALAGDSGKPVDPRPTPIPMPGPTDHDHDNPGAPGIKFDLAAAERVPHGERSAGFFVVLDPTPHLTGTPGPRGPIRSPSPVERWADGLIPVLCRFLC